jgi:hypothetical protein
MLKISRLGGELLPVEGAFESGKDCLIGSHLSVSAFLARADRLSADRVASFPTSSSVANARFLHVSRERAFLFGISF